MWPTSSHASSWSSHKTAVGRMTQTFTTWRQGKRRTRATHMLFNSQWAFVPTAWYDALKSCSVHFEPTSQDAFFLPSDPVAQPPIGGARELIRISLYIYIMFIYGIYSLYNHIIWWILIPCFHIYFPSLLVRLEDCCTRNCVFFSCTRSSRPAVHCAWSLVWLTQLTL